MVTAINTMRKTDLITKILIFKSMKKMHVLVEQKFISEISMMGFELASFS